MAETTDYEAVGREWADAHGKTPLHIPEKSCWLWIGDGDGEIDDPAAIPQFLMTLLGWRDESPHISEQAAYDALGRAITECRRAVAVGSDELATLRTQLAAAEARAVRMEGALRELACLGNGDRPGNSICNVIAQRGLADAPQAMRGGEAKTRLRCWVSQSGTCHVRTGRNQLDGMCFSSIKPGWWLFSPSVAWTIRELETTRHWTEISVANVRLMLGICPAAIAEIDRLESLTKETADV